jgi:hypothetical protein
MLPAGPTSRYAKVSQVGRRTQNKGSKNRVSEAFGRALRFHEEQGWIDRGREFIRIRDRGALLDSAMRGLLKVPEHFISLDRVVAEIRADLAQPGLPAATAAQRHRELRAIQDLMKSPVQGVYWSGRGSVRFVNKGKAF